MVAGRRSNRRLIKFCVHCGDKILEAIMLNTNDTSIIYVDYFSTNRRSTLLLLHLALIATWVHRASY